tara:strand:+ start:1271 stop:1522 length:252 start_codon:yes stop_codon:yes gene_type:complete
MVSTDDDPLYLVTAHHFSLLRGGFRKGRLDLEAGDSVGEKGLNPLFHGLVLAVFYLFYFEKIRVFKARRFRLLNIVAWDNRKR